MPLLSSKLPVPIPRDPSRLSAAVCMQPGLVGVLRARSRVTGTGTQLLSSTTPVLGSSSSRNFSSSPPSSIPVTQSDSSQTPTLLTAKPAPTPTPTRPLLRTGRVFDSFSQVSAPRIVPSMAPIRLDQSQRRGQASHLSPTLHAATATAMANGAVTAAAAVAAPGTAVAAAAPPPPSSACPPVQTFSAFVSSASASGPSRLSSAFSSSSPFFSTTNPAAVQLKRGSLPATATATASSRTAQLARHFTTSSSARSSSNTSSGNNNNSDGKMASPYTVRKVGQPYTLDHRVYIEKDGVPISPFHDIPLYANPEGTILNMIVEIPRWTNAKLEISKDELLNPIKQDTKKGKLRYVRNCFPHKGYLWNYGAFPQTWEDPNSIHPETKAKGDNDPLDVCEIGELVGYTGQVKQVKVLGVMALLDEEETDWKVIVIDVNDPLAPKLNDVEDVERHLPGLLRATNEWFRIYKIPDGKPENQFAFTGECKNKAYAMDVIRECNEAWEKLITGKTQPGNISLTNLTVGHSASRVAPEQLPPLPQNQDLPPAPIDASIDKWFFISGASA
ncbi:hypothetical protein VTJ04DRAFT_1002 [Mycothermus thermophilus]|uniref:uncharacterized protein n=1 Tax=Humicola insolens TaxID=85995 RepID=UPI00374484F0